MKNIIEKILKKHKRVEAEEKIKVDLPKTKKSAAVKKSNRTVALGLVMVFLSVVGFVTITVFAVSVTVNFFKNTNQKEMFANEIYSLVISDVPPFEDVNNLQNSTKITAAIWEVILKNRPDRFSSTFEYSISVPAADVEKNLVSLFGENVIFEHESISTDAFGIDYDDSEEKNEYLVPDMIQSPMFFPQVNKITKSGNVFTLNVSYMITGMSWGSLSESGDREHVLYKNMEYELIRISKNNYIITAIRDIIEDTNEDESESETSDTSGDEG
ncbi:MAG: hypothetical protein FWH14_08885 [Oscillospiraceae bacterium]|nr:hypothetical protein [Oscillospiraceae bacterium]